MAAGQPIVRLLQLESAAGVAQSYANAAAFTAAGWNLSFEDLNGTTLSPQPTWTIADEGSGMHRVNIATEPTDDWYAKITVPGGFYTPQLTLTGDGDGYTIDDLAGLMLQTAGTPTSTGSRLEGNFDDWIEEDYFSVDIVVPQAGLTKIGAVGLTGVTVTAAAKQPYPTKESAAIEEIVFTAAILDAAARTVRLTKTWDVALALTTGEIRRDYIVEVSCELTAKRVTTNRYSLALVWQADTRGT